MLLRMLYVGLDVRRDVRSYVGLYVIRKGVAMDVRSDVKAVHNRGIP